MTRKPRDITPEEHAQWRAETKHDSPIAASDGIYEDAPELPEEVAKPCAPPKRAAKPRAAALMVGDLSRLDGNSAKAFTKPTKTRDSVIDLHDMNQEQAHRALMQFMQHALERKLRQLRIITGKGARSGGVLRRNVVHWLETPVLRPQIKALAYAPAREGGEGVLLVLLKHPR